jgi:sugar lactone lactonase YvrE
VPQVLTAIRPGWAAPGGRVTLSGTNLPLGPNGPPRVQIGELNARVVAASRQEMTVVVPLLASGGTTAVRIEESPGETVFLEVAEEIATDVHQVDSPVFDRLGRLYLTQSGGRGTKVPVPLYRIGRDRVREPLAVEIANPTSMTVGPDGLLYISNRFEGHVQRLTPDDQVELYATELGVPTGLAFGPDGSLYVGDRSGSILRISPERQVDTFATLPLSVAAFHLSFGPDDCLYVSSQSLATHDPIYRITPDRLVDVWYEGFGRPQGLAFDSTGTLFVVEALAGEAGLYRMNAGHLGPEPELMCSAPTLVGVAFDPEGGVILASSEAIWRIAAPLRPPA